MKERGQEQTACPKDDHQHGTASFESLRHVSLEQGKKQGPFHKKEKLEGSIIEIKINKEIQHYQESILFGLSLRQMVFALLAIGVAVGTYFGLRPLIGTAEVGWVCMLAAFPFALCGFFTYNGMPAERFLLAVIRSEILCPRTLSYHPRNLYAEVLLDNVSMREVLLLD